jgi:hypothetical protein
MARPSLEWMDSAACRTVYDFTDLEQHKQRMVCVHCPVTAECALFEISFADEPFTGKDLNGIVYGGLTDKQLIKAKRLRRRAAR